MIRLKMLRITAILAKIYLSMLRPFGKIKIKTPSITANILLRYCTILILFLVIIAIHPPQTPPLGIPAVKLNTMPPGV